MDEEEENEGEETRGSWVDVMKEIEGIYDKVLWMDDKKELPYPALGLNADYDDAYTKINEVTSKLYKYLKDLQTNLKLKNG